MSLASAAIAYSKLGLAIFPCSPAGKTPLLRSSGQGKGGYHDATSDPEQIERWWSEHPEANIGLPCAPNSLIAIDIDPRNGGDETYLKLVAELGQLPSTLSAKTGGDGWHYLFRSPGEPVKGALGPGVDIKNNGYVLVSPSVHPSGGIYKWVNAPHAHKPAELPEKWLNRATKKPERHIPEETAYNRASEATTPYGRAALDEEYQALAHCPEGQRNNTLNRAAFCLGQLVAGGEIAESDAREALWQACKINGIAQSERSITGKSIASGLEAGMADPRKAPPGEHYSAQDAHRDWLEACKQGEAGWIPPAIGDTWSDFIAELEDRLEGGFEPVPTGIDGLDRLLGGGLPRAQTTVIAAPPGFGKTSFALGCCKRWAQAGHPSLFWSLELPSVDAHARLVCLSEALPWNQVREGLHMECCKKLSAEYRDLPMYLLDNEQLPAAKLGEAVSAIISKHGEAPLLVVDYAQLLADPANEAETRSASEKVAKGLLDLAKATKMAVVALSSVARHAYNLDADPSKQLGVAKESGRWESDAAVMIGIVPVGESEPRDRRGWLVVAKNRLAGGVGKVPVTYDGLAGTWEELSPEQVPETGGRGSLSDVELKCQIIEAVTRHQLTTARSISEMITCRKKRCLATIANMLREGSLSQGKDKIFRAGGQS